LDYFSFFIEKDVEIKKSRHSVYSLFSDTICLIKDSRKTFYFEKLPKTAKYSAKINTVVETVTFRQLTKAVSSRFFGAM
jgi:hypothetical protein